MRRLLVIFALSGAAGLIYEVVWARQLVLVFGNTTQAVSAILTGFFGGMAIGSAVGGRIADRVRHPLRMYGALELILVVVVLATPLTFGLVRELYRGVFSTLEGAPIPLALLRFALALVALAPATILMGATLPTLTRHLTRHSGAGLGASFGRLYAANTTGAIAGTIAAGFVLIELFGLTGALAVGAACSGLAGVGALLMARHAPATTVEAAEIQPAGPGSNVQRRASRRGLALAIAFVSGLTSLGYQVLWTRVLASGTGNSTYVFTTILAVFLIGLALGALAFAFVRGRVRDPVSLIAHCQVLISLLALVGVALVIDRNLTGYLPLVSDFGALVSSFIGPVAEVVLPATFVMGLVFPATALLLGGSDGEVGADAGALLAANTLGAIVGTFVVPFVAISAFGSPASIALLAGVNALTGVTLALRGHVRLRAHRLVVGLGGAGATAVIVVALLSGTVFVDPNIAAVRSAGGQVFASTEDEIASVQAGEIFGSKQLWVTGTSMTGLTVDTKLMPILPLMLRPTSKTELTIAFGMGSAFRAALIAGLKADAVELVPSVPSMFGFYYPDASSVLNDPNGRVIIADGRNYVELTDRTYDIIVVDPPPPIETSGVSVIASLEFYEAAHARLSPGGVMMQWVPFGQSIDEFKAHVRTFQSAFRNVIVAAGPGGNGFYMLGSDDPLAFDPATMRDVLTRPGVLADVSSAVDSPRHDLAGWLALIPEIVRLSGPQVAEFAGPGPLITDDRPLPEYFLLRHSLGAPSPRLQLGLVRAPPAASTR